MQSLKEVAPYIRGIWTAIGPLLGVLVGALLARSWDKKKWMNDNRKAEFRELITALTNAATALMMQQTHLNEHRLQTDEEEHARQTHLEAWKVIKTRIFIAHDVKEMKLFDRWGESIKAMRATKKVHPFEDSFEKLKDEIVERAKS
jgi:hypothetical protein